MEDRLNFRKIVLKTEIHPTAIVAPGAKIGWGVKIGPYSVIGESVELGDGCVVGPHVLIEGRTTIGQNNVFHHGASIGGVPQDLNYSGGVSFLVIGDDNRFREHCTVHIATNEGASTKIGSNCFVMAYSHVAHDCRIGDHVILSNSVNLGGFVVMDDFSIVGGVAPVHQYVKIGKHAFVGGGSRVERDIPPFIKAAGSPTRAYGINSVGLERRGFTLERRAMIKDIFNLLYRSNLNVTQVLERLRNGSFVDPERQIFVDFLEASQRGITK